MIDRTLSRLLQLRLAQVGDLIKATQRVLLCRVRQSVTTGRQWVANLADYLRAKA
jgi:hypothetical protein